MLRTWWPTRSLCRTYTDHRNLACIFEPEACISSVPKTGAQRLENWKIVLAQYDYRIMHYSGQHICWTDLLSRWIKVPAVAVRAVAVFASSAPDETMPSKDAVREVQQQARAGLSSMVNGASSFTTPVGRATKDNEDLFRVGLDGQDVLGIPEQAKEMQTRLMVCAHNEGRRTPGGRGDFAAATRVVLLVLDGGSRDRVRQALSTLHGLEDG